MLKNMEKELQLLKRELAMHDTLANRSQVTYEPLSEQQRYEIRQQVRAYLDGKSDDIEVRAPVIALSYMVPCTVKGKGKGKGSGFI